MGRSEAWRTPRGVAQVKYFYGMAPLADLVVDEHRAVHQLSHIWSRAYGAAHTREPDEQLDVIEQTCAESRGGVRIVGRDMADDPG